MNKYIILSIFIVTFLSLMTSFQHSLISKNKAKNIECWLTKGDQSILFEKQTNIIVSNIIDNRLPIITLDPKDKHQTIEGFGYTLTGGSAMLIQKMSPEKRKELLQDLFSCKDHGKCISYLRLTMGASDLDEKVFSYNDLPPGQTDPDLDKFTLSNDTIYLIPLINQIIKINPDIKFIATPWSPPLWMKSNKESIGGKLLKEYYAVYALYFIKFLDAMELKGIKINAVSVQNEPEHGGNNPSLTIDWQEQNEFIKNHLGPAFKKYNKAVKILLWDHNCDHPDYPISILNDPETRNYVYGSAFHLYAGDISALSKVYNMYPDKKLYLTEQWTGAKGEFKGDLLWHLKNVVIGSLNNYSSVVMQWNLANDPAFGPHTPGGCTECKGALTIGKDQYIKNVAYYNIIHASKFIPPGSVRIGSKAIPKLNSVAFLTPSNEKVMLMCNDQREDIKFQLDTGNGIAVFTIPGESVVTLRF